MIFKITVKGAVQGVGYRPFILKKATEYGLKGFVRNIGAAVDILVCGDEENILGFTSLIKSEYPAGAFILSVESKEISEDEVDPSVYDEFKIIYSEELDLSSELPVFLPDIGICDDCLKEMLDKDDRRYRYPLISCVSCGPRISILNKLPYDRDTITMEDFEMCPSCASEYKKGRRTYAQTISCHDCGPQFELLDLKTNNILSGQEAIDGASDILNNDGIIGLKGMSGYQLVCRPNDRAAGLLREVKGREQKPFAVMFSDIDSAKEFCLISAEEEKLLKSMARPIVLCNVKKEFPYEVCKDSRYIGAFLPSTGIHRLLCDSCGPLIVTSANISDEPIIIDDNDFISSFSNKCVEAVLIHKRKINMPQDDSVAFVTKLSDESSIVSFNRRARGYVPLPVLINGTNNESKIIAFGGDLKSTFSFGYKDKVITSQYLGDLKDMGVNENLQKLIKDYERIFHFNPQKVICDLHPLYESVRMAKEYSKKQNLPLFQVQHHHAHILSVMAEKSLKSCIGISFDGTGYGTDGNIWGGEVLLCNGTEYKRIGHLGYVKLCGGDNASRNAKLVKECYYNAAGLSENASQLVKAALDNDVNVFKTSSVGRLFDAVSALLNIKEENSFEGECAIALEKAAWNYYETGNTDFSEIDFDLVSADDGYVLNQVKLFSDIARAFELDNSAKDNLAYLFHLAIVEGICKVCSKARDEYGEKKICLSGGVFGNRLLLSRSVERLRSMGFEVYVNEIVPAGDAGISLGQAYYGLLKED